MSLKFGTSSDYSIANNEPKQIMILTCKKHSHFMGPFRKPIIRNNE